MPVLYRLFMIIFGRRLEMFDTSKRRIFVLKNKIYIYLFLVFFLLNCNSQSQSIPEEISVPSPPENPPTKIEEIKTEEPNVPVEETNPPITKVEEESPQAEIEEKEIEIVQIEEPEIPPLPTIVEQPIVQPPEQPVVRPPVERPPERPRVNTGWYTVRAGDTLRKIAIEIYGDESKWIVIYYANEDIISPDTIYPGMRLRIPPR